MPTVLNEWEFTEVGCSTAGKAIEGNKINVFNKSRCSAERASFFLSSSLPPSFRLLLSFLCSSPKSVRTCAAFLGDNLMPRREVFGSSRHPLLTSVLPPELSL